MDLKSKIEAAEIIGMDPRQVQFYVDRGLVKAYGGGSRGARLKLDEEAIFHGMVIKELWQYKMGVHEIGRVIDHVRKYSPGVQKINEMVKNGDAIYITVKTTPDGVEPGYAEYNLKVLAKFTIPNLMQKSKSIIVVDAGKIAAVVASL